MTDDCSHQVHGSSQSSSVEPHLDYTEIDESTSILDAGFGNDLERDHDLAPPTRSINDGTRDVNAANPSFCRQAYTLGTHRPEIILRRRRTAGHQRRLPQLAAGYGL